MAVEFTEGELAEVEFAFSVTSAFLEKIKKDLERSKKESFIKTPFTSEELYSEDFEATVRGERYIFCRFVCCLLHSFDKTDGLLYGWSHHDEKSIENENIPNAIVGKVIPEKHFMESFVNFCASKAEHACSGQFLTRMLDSLEVEKEKNGCRVFDIKTIDRIRKQAHKAGISAWMSDKDLHSLVLSGKTLSMNLI